MKNFLDKFLFLLSTAVIVYSLIGIIYSYKGVKPATEIFESVNENQKFAYISGAVENPGVYEIDNDTNVIDLVEIAGGFNSAVNLEYLNNQLNLAQRVFNGDHVKIFFKNEIDSSNVNTVPQSSLSNGLISINNASDKELETLPGVGPSTAEKIISGRPYSQIEDLMNVSGIGDATFQKLKPYIVL